MGKEVIRHHHKYAKAMYVMVSIPEAKAENIYKSPVVLGVYTTKEDAKIAWKARTAEYKSIKAKTIHIYYFTLQTDVPEIADTIFFSGTYRVSEYGGELHFVFLPGDSYPDIESYYNVLAWVNQFHPISFRNFCEKSNGWETFYASNELFCMPCPVNKLVIIPVPFTDTAQVVDNM